MDSCRGLLVSVPDPNQPQHRLLSVSCASDTCAGLKVWERDSKLVHLDNGFHNIV